MSYLKLLAPLTFCMLLTVGACGDGSGDQSTVTATNEAVVTPLDSPTPAGSAAYCNDEAISAAADTWVQSVTLLIAEKPQLVLSDEDGLRNDIEAATRRYCEVGTAPTLKDVDVYCDGIVAAIDLRLDGPTADRDAFLTEYYNTCNATD